MVFKDFNQRFSNDSYPTLKDKYYLNFTAFIADSEETCKKIENILISKNIKLKKIKILVILFAQLRNQNWIILL